MTQNIVHRFNWINAFWQSCVGSSDYFSALTSVYLCFSAEDLGSVHKRRVQSHQDVLGGHLAATGSFTVNRRGKQQEEKLTGMDQVHVSLHHHVFSPFFSHVSGEFFSCLSFSPPCSLFLQSADDLNNLSSVYIRLEATEREFVSTIALWPAVWSLTCWVCLL